MYKDLSIGHGFIRYFGEVKSRINGWPGPKQWVKDAYYASAKNALIVPDLGQYYGGHYKTIGTEPPEILLKPLHLSRRLFCDGRALARVEMGLSFENPIRMDERQSMQVIKDYLTLPTKVPSFHGGYVTNELAYQNTALANLFLYATSKKDYIQNTDFKSNTVISGNPIVFLEYDETAKSPYGKPLNQKILPETVKKIDKSITKNISLAYYTFKNKGKPIGLWFIGYNNKNKDDVRLLKLCLLRLNAEQEILKNIVSFIINTINSDPQSIEINQLITYLNYSTSVIFKEKRGGFSQNKILDTLNQCESLANDTEIHVIQSSLLALKEIGIPSDIQKKVDSYFEKILRLLKAWPRK